MTETQSVSDHDFLDNGPKPPVGASFAIINLLSLGVIDFHFLKKWKTFSVKPGKSPFAF